MTDEIFYFKWHGGFWRMRQRSQQASGSQEGNPAGDTRDRPQESHPGSPSREFHDRQKETSCPGCGMDLAIVVDSRFPGDILYL
jgi:hypothetical protein